MNAYGVITTAIYNGIQLGLHRAKKHVDAPSDDALHEAIEYAIICELSDVIDWGSV